MDIITKIKQANLVGRGGACFPVAAKWLAVKKAAGNKKYVICNAAEGEPGVAKDSYIIERHINRVIDGMRVAWEYLSAGKVKNEIAVEGYFYINNKYYKRYGKKLIKAIGNLPIKIFIKPYDAGYIGGEESAILNAIEGRRVEPRLKPPYPTERGLWNCPTLINNVETFYEVSQVASGDYKNYRFYTVSGDCLNSGVYELPNNFTIGRVLKETENLPDFPFFVQVGGNAAGEVLNNQQLKQPVSGGGSIAVFSLIKYQAEALLENWLEFFTDESCGQCTPCREGLLRLHELIRKEKIDWLLFNELIDNLKEAAFCGLGSSAAIPLSSFMKNVLPLMAEKKLDLPRSCREEIYKYFK